MNLRNRMNRNKVQDYSYRSAARYNKRNDEIFASYEKYLQKEMEWLRRQGVSEDEIQNAYRHTGLGGSGIAKLIQQVALENGDNRELSEILGEAHSISDSRRIKDEFIDNLYYNFGGSGRYNEDYEMYDEDYDVAEYLMNEADLLEDKYSVYEREGDTVENWEQCIRGYFDLVDKTDVKDVDSVFRILEDANFHLLNWVLLLEKGTDKDVQEAIDFIFDDTDNYIQRNQRYTALRNVINEMGIV